MVLAFAGDSTMTRFSATGDRGPFLRRTRSAAHQTSPGGGKVGAGGRRRQPGAPPSCQPRRRSGVDRHPATDRGVPLGGPRRTAQGAGARRPVGARRARCAVPGRPALAGRPPPAPLRPRPWASRRAGVRRRSRRPAGALDGGRHLPARPDAGFPRAIVAATDPDRPSPAGDPGRPETGPRPKGRPTVFD
jgi:hypothetical protein